MTRVLLPLGLVNDGLHLEAPLSSMELSLNMFWFFNDVGEDEDCSMIWLKQNQKKQNNSKNHWELQEKLKLQD